MASTKAHALPHLNPGELSLLDLAAEDPRDVVALSEKEELILQLHHQIQEQELEKALLQQDLDLLSGDDAEEQLAIAERDLLEARATYTVRRKAIGIVLMTDPTLKAVHMKATTPAERTLLPLLNRRDMLSLAHENLNSAHSATVRNLSTAEVENRQLHKKNGELVQELLEITKDDDSWMERLEDDELKAQLEQQKSDYKKSKAKWDTVKNLVSAIVVGSGVDWAADDALAGLVLDESDD
ncbi:centromere protein H [Aspergillus candidus]|uniref:Centromere protein H (CENP-H)-domain-containing protein n=1 Tax=Aspergillus candidus TaxID=41067 RepID=A0A2I2FJF7_ASPCN|nr:centromere protein H (CENP-H)-domain-containing protein [Aspergillus candidus]PLB40744.1 centromere protein H (CENP-H)-domain-containing protein [Aspergillus candidus]